MPKTKRKTPRKTAKTRAKRSRSKSRLVLAGVLLALVTVLAAGLSRFHHGRSVPSPAEAAAALQWAESHTGQASTTALAVSPEVRPYSQYFFQLKNPHFQINHGPRPEVVLRVARPGAVQAHILDAGQHVIRVLANLSQPQGSIQFDWDGRDAKNQACPPGRYLLVVASPDKLERHEIKILP